MRSPLRNMLLTALFAALTAVGAFLRIPLGYSSFTLQVFFTCMAGVLLGPYWGAASQAVYVLLGLVGLPIFTKGGGLWYLSEPTFGFLLGLIPMAFTIGMLMKHLRFKPFLRIALSCVVGLVVLYVVGLPYFYYFFTIVLANGWSFGETVVSCCLIFLPYDALKILVASLLGSKLYGRL